MSVGVCRVTIRQWRLWRLLRPDRSLGTPSPSGVSDAATEAEALTQGGDVAEAAVAVVELLADDGDGDLNAQMAEAQAQMQVKQALRAELQEIDEQAAQVGDSATEAGDSAAEAVLSDTVATLGPPISGPGGDVDDSTLELEGIGTSPSPTIEGQGVVDIRVGVAPLYPAEFVSIAIPDLDSTPTPPAWGGGNTWPPRRPSGRTLGIIIGVFALAAGAIVGGLLASSGSSGSRGEPSVVPSTTTPLPASVGAASTTTTTTHPTTTTTGATTTNSTFPIG